MKKNVLNFDSTPVGICCQLLRGLAILLYKDKMKLVRS